MNKFLCKLQDKVIVRFSNSFHQHTNISDDLLLMAINYSQQKIVECYEEGSECVQSVDCKFHVGVTHCIECTQGNSYVYFKQRGERPYLSRMVKGAIPPKTTYITIILRPSGNSNMDLITAWIGEASEPELGNINYFEKSSFPHEAIARSAEFWINHALIEEYPTAIELYEDIYIITQRLGETIETISNENLLKIVEARIGKPILKSVSRCVSREKEKVVEWLEMEIVPTYLVPDTRI